LEGKKKAPVNDLSLTGAWEINLMSNRRWLEIREKNLQRTFVTLQKQPDNPLTVGVEETHATSGAKCRHPLSAWLFADVLVAAAPVNTGRLSIFRVDCGVGFFQVTALRFHRVPFTEPTRPFLATHARTHAW
jgi:hypothetical protein